MTNADRIRKMSDDELNALLISFVYDSCLCPVIPDFMDWLQSEITEECVEDGSI